MDVTLNSIWQVRYFCQNAEQVSVNTLYLKVSSITGPGSTLQDFATMLDSYGSLAYQPVLPLEALYLGVQAKQTSAPTQRSYSSSAFRHTGTSGDTISAPRQAAGIITKWSDADVSNPAMRGRVFMPFIPISFIGTNGNLTVGAQTLYGTWAGRMLTSNVWTSIDTLTSFILLPMMYRVRGVHYNGVIRQIALRLKVGTQRRRGSYGIPNVSPF